MLNHNIAFSADAIIDYLSTSGYLLLFDGPNNSQVVNLVLALWLVDAGLNV